MKSFSALALLLVCSSCTTLENRRDLYDPDREIYPPPAKTTTTTTTVRQTTGGTRNESRQPAVEHEETVTVPAGP